MKKVFLVLFLILLICNFVFADNNYSELTSGITKISFLKKYKDINFNILAINKLKQQENSLAESNKGIIKKYVLGAVRGEDTFLLINCNLRNNLGSYIPSREITKPLKYRLNYYSEQLSASISKVKLPQNIILYRGIEERELKTLFKDKNLNEITRKVVTDDSVALFNNLIKGQKYTDNGFMLTSYDKNKIEKTKYRFEIKSPKNLQAVLIEDICPEMKKQILVNKGYKWEVVAVSKEYDKEKRDFFYNISVKLVLN